MSSSFSASRVCFFLPSSRYGGQKTVASLHAKLTQEGGYWRGKVIVFVGPRPGRLGELPYTDDQVTCTTLRVSCAIQ